MGEHTSTAQRIDDLLRQADASYRSGDVARARQTWQSVLEIEPLNARAADGLRLAGLSLDGGSAGEPADLRSRLGRVQELLDSGLVEDAALAAGELRRDVPNNPEVEASFDRARSALRVAPVTANSIEEARAALARGDGGRAAEACRRVLQLEPLNVEAQALLDEALRTGAASARSRAAAPRPRAAAPGPAAPAGPDLELDLDLALSHAFSAPAAPRARAAQAAAPPAPPKALANATAPVPALARAEAALSAPPVAPVVPRPPAPAEQELSFGDLFDEGPLAPSRRDDDPASVNGLLEAADELQDALGAPPAAHAPSPGAVADVEPGSGEAALLVAKAQDALARGDLEEATGHASRALAIREDTPGAQDIMDHARAIVAERSNRADHLISDATRALDDGDPGAAVPMLTQALELAPGHPEATALLERARAAGTAPPGITRTSTPPPPEQPLVAAVPAPPVVPRAAAALGEIPALPAMGAAVSRPAAPVPPPRRNAAAAKSASRSRAPLLVALLLIGAAGAGAWYWFGSRGGGDEKAAAPAPVKRAAGVKPKGAPVNAPATATPAATEPVYGPSDVPRLVATARERLAAGDEAAAVALFETARKADPADFRLVDELEVARTALRARQDADTRMNDVHQLWADQDYAEALRLLYRVPEKYQPRGYKRMIADGWYNMGVQRLQTGDVAEADQYFRDCLELAPDDDDAARAREVAKRYRRRALDDPYRLYVGGLAFRPL
ncbi:MAG: hypothetical protein KBD01_03930 [Acidobacteria bacterium]|nr:hypothetical protein [Acidobacteriota bacterium]